MDLVSEFIVAIQPMVVKTSTFQNESVFQHFQLHTDRTSVRRASNMINLERIRQDQGAGSRGVGPPRSQSERPPPSRCHEGEPHSSSNDPEQIPLWRELS